MLQINLLPDIKQEFIRTTRNKRVVLLSAIVVGGVCLTIMLLLVITVNIFQRKHLSDLNKDIASYTKDLKNTPDLDKILTVQNQLNNLTALHDAKPATTRLLGYVQSITPTLVNITNLSVDFEKSTIKINGTADSLGSINKYVDTLKFTDYKIDDIIANKAFTNVVLSSFSRSSIGAGYEIGLVFDPAIFNNTKAVTLAVPNTITSRSEVEKPTALFQADPAASGGQ